MLEFVSGDWRQRDTNMQCFTLLLNIKADLKHIEEKVNDGLF